MRATAQLLAGGFFRRSLDEFKRLSNTALKLEGLRTPTGPYVLFSFSDPSDLAACKVMSDANNGGFSHAALSFIPAHPPLTPAHARFHGSISLDLPAHRPEIQRTGYAGFRTLDRRATIFGKSLWDIDPYTYLALRVKSDGRKYFVNLQTESIIPTDIHQHRLYVRRPGEWETVFIKFHEFVRTNHGTVVEPQREMLRQKVRSVGVSLIDRVPGPFDLSVERIWATNRLVDEERGDGEVAELGHEEDSKEAGEPGSVKGIPKAEKILM